MNRSWVLWPALTLLLLAPLAGAVPLLVNHEGMILDEDGLPMEGQVTLRLALYDRAERGASLWFEEYQVQLIDGYYLLRLGEQNDISGFFQGDERYLGIAVNHGEELRPRHRLVSVPYAIIAENAVGDISPRSVWVNGRQVIDDRGNWVGPPVPGAGDGVGYDTPQEVLAALRTVDGTGSDLDADSLDGLDSSLFLRVGFELEQLVLDGVLVADTSPAAVRLGSLDADGLAVDLFCHGRSQVRIAADGFVGIGTTSPRARLHVNGNTVLGPNVENSVARLQLSEDTGTHPFMTFHENSRVVNAIGNHVHDLGFNAANNIVFKTGYQWNRGIEEIGSEHMRVTREGRVGIGTSSPTQKLQVTDSAAGNIGITIQNKGSGQPQVRFLNRAGTERAALTYVPSDESFRIFLTGSNRIFIRSDGHVGIGTQTPHDQLEVAQTISAGNVVPRAANTGSIGTADRAWDQLHARQVRLAPRSAPDCDEEHAGALYFDEETRTFRGCNGEEWIELSGGGGGGDGNPGESQDNPAASCMVVQDANVEAGSGLYWIRPGQSTYQAWCDMESAGGGWTRVGRLAGAIQGYCLGDPRADFDLQTDPHRRAGKLRDAEVRAILSSPGARRELMFYVGAGGRGRFLYHALFDVSHYDTSDRNGRRDAGYCSDWICADGSRDGTACGGEGSGCPVVGRGRGGNAKKLYIDSSFGAHHSALHAGGGFCGLDNRARYDADVYVR